MRLCYIIRQPALRISRPSRHTTQKSKPIRYPKVQAFLCNVRGSNLAPNIDLRILLDLNSMVPPNSRGAIFWDFIGNNPLCRGFPIFFPVVALWFSSDYRRRRSRMLVGLLSTCVAVLLSVWIQHHINVHVRPFLDPTLHLQSTPPAWTVGLRHLNSFPSDTATLFFALTAVVFLENRMAGCIALLWSLIAACVARVATGWHYPSDVVGGFVLGVGCVFLATRIRPLLAFFERRLEQWQPRIYILHAILFLFLADAYVLFAGLQSFCNVFVQMGAYLIRQL
jgi:membrane-associated phospholipid phosphatase